jgi:hypothetical protein
MGYGFGKTCPKRPTYPPVTISRYKQMKNKQDYPNDPEDGSRRPNVPPDQFRPGDMLELALSIFNSNEPPVRTLEQIRLDLKRQRRKRAYRRLLAENAQRRLEAAQRKERLKGA